MKLFFTTLQQVGILTIFIFIGYLFRRKNWISDDGKKTLAKLLVCCFAPCYSVMSLSKVVNVYDIVQYMYLIFSGVGVTFVGILLANLFARWISRERLQRNIFIYALAFSNIGYFGYPVVAAIFGEIMRAQMMLFCLPMSIAINIYGYYLLSNKEQKECSIKQKLSVFWGPLMIGTYVGILLGLLSSGFGFELPRFIIGIVETAGNCQSPVAMLLTGAALASVPLGKLFVSWRPYVIGAIRLLVLPIIVGLGFLLMDMFSSNGEIFTLIFRLSVITMALPVGMNTVVFPESAGLDGTDGARTCFMSYLLALATMPLIFTLMEMMVKIF